MTRQFVVTAVQGHTDITKLSDLGPRYVEVMVDASNRYGESITFRRPLDDQPHVGDTVEFDDIPTSALFTKDLL